ncbi:hypothetical protein [Deinococcus sp. QL22]|uniref:hypothetical protein n=1 Tax=Deinococcus sp. QL22 TaxID=2939437 RepID=UPI0020177A50|nr:hypothetical protein [Deinococcus sp. QL22]UQN10159.1 hypothetical protein M1R55_28665 [Deinococcus sp. QL22]
MNMNSRLIALMAALAAGSAAAATAGTTAGTTIQNVAQATFDNPDVPGTPATPITSNFVYSTVNAIAAFDIVYTDGSLDGNTATTPATSYDKANVLPGSTVTTPYTVVNNGNIDNFVVNLAADSTGTANAPASVVYYLASDTSFTTPITLVTIPNGGQVDIVQRLTVPMSAVAGTTYSTSPHGTSAAGTISTTLPDTTVVTTPYVAKDERDNINPPAVAPVNSDLQFTRATIYAPIITPPAAPITPLSPVLIPPTTPGTPPADPNNPPSAPGTPTVPSDPTTPGYQDPNPPTGTTPTPGGTTPITSIAISGNDQFAYPPAGVTQVTFNNNVRNGGAVTDVIQIFPTDPATGLPIGGTPTSAGVYTVSAVGTVGTSGYVPGYTVQFLSSTGAPLTMTTAPGGSVAYPSVSVISGSDVQYRTVVTYPDQALVANADPVSIPVPVGLSSTNKGTAPTKADTFSTDTILPPGLLFGDSATPHPDPSLIGPGNTAQVVVPGTTAVPGVPASGAPTTNPASDPTAIFPMDIKNTGQYNDTYTLTKSTVKIFLNDGSSVDVPVRYVYASGAAVSTDTAGNFITNVVGANTTLTVYAVVDVPNNAKATTGTIGLNPNPVLNQPIVSNFSNSSYTDTNDQLKIGSTGTITMVKTQAVNSGAYSTANATPLPGDTLKYRIVATNSYNASIFNFKLVDSSANTAFTYTNFVTASVTLTGFGGQTPALASMTPYYSTNSGASFSSAVPTAAAVAAGGLTVAIDTDNSGTITVADVLPGSATITLDITTTVK